MTELREQTLLVFVTRVEASGIEPESENGLLAHLRT